MNKFESSANILIEELNKLGILEADVIFISSKSLSVNARLGKLEGTEQSEAADLGLRVIKDGKQLTISTTEISKESLIELAKKASIMVASVPKDEYCGLPNKSLYMKKKPELDLVDSVIPNDQDLLATALETEDAALSVRGVTNTEGASSSFSKYNISLVNTDGFSASLDRTFFSASVSVIAGKGTEMERDYEYQNYTHLEDLDNPHTIGTIAGERAVSRLYPKKIKSNAVPVIFDNRVSGGLISILTNSISGQIISRGTSFLKDKLGKNLFHSEINIYDDPLRMRGHRSRPFDVEGVETKASKIISKGVLETWILDCRSARQLELETTGHASRNTNSPPSPAPSNVYLGAGNISRNDLIKSVKEGFYVTEMMGMSFNQVTGDYSRGATGFWINNGKLTFPVSEVTIAGNMLDIYKRLIPASDLNFKTGIDAPTVLIEKMTVAGL